MAGEWIKLETATLNKPEVLRMGRTLGVTKHHVVGLLVRFWVWLDVNSVDGVVDGVETRDVDDVVSQDGFAVALASVGWLEIDAITPGIRVPKFGRHNGESAKKRALKNERQARWRANSVGDAVDAPAPTKASTREEKRRSNTPVVPDGFAAFWLIYPRKDKKANALQAWKRLAPDGALQEKIAADVRRRTAGLDWTKEGGTFIPHPASYLNSRRWEDEGIALPDQPKRVQL